METILVQLTSETAYQRLQELETLHIIKVIKKKKSKLKPSERFAGKLSSEVANKLKRHIKKSRDEWEQRLSA